MIYKEYKFNEKFRAYVNKYAKKHGIPVDEALQHELVRQAYLYYTEV